jgi:transposase
MVLACADGMPNARVAEVFGVSDMTVATWRSRFAQGRLDARRPGRPKTGLVLSDAERPRLRCMP